MRPLEAWLLVVVLALAASACSRLTFIRPNPKVGDTERAMPDYDFKDPPAVKRENQVRDLVALAQERLRAGQLDEAESKVKEILRIDAKSADAYTLLGVIADQRGQTQQAGGHYAKAAELAPREGVTLNNYGAWLCANGRADESLSWFDRAIADPAYRSRASASGNAGACALRAGRIERVDHDLRLALESEPENAVALAAMADYQLRLGHFLEARAFSERRLAAAPADPDALRIAARIEGKLGDKTAADRYLDRLHTEFPQAGIQTGEPVQP